MPSTRNIHWSSFVPCIVTWWVCKQLIGESSFFEPTRNIKEIAMNWLSMITKTLKIKLKSPYCMFHIISLTNDISYGLKTYSLNRSNISPSVIFQWITFHWTESSSSIDTTKSIQSIVNNWNSESSSLVIHWSDSHPNVKSRIVSKLIVIQPETCDKEVSKYYKLCIMHLSGIRTLKG